MFIPTKAMWISIPSIGARYLNVCCWLVAHLIGSATAGCCSTPKQIAQYTTSPILYYASCRVLLYKYEYSAWHRKNTLIFAIENICVFYKIEMGKAMLSIYRWLENWYLGALCVCVNVCRHDNAVPWSWRVYAAMNIYDHTLCQRSVGR